MAIDLSLLDPQLANKIPQLIENCRDKGATYVPYFGLRTPQMQADLWRQSRSTQEVNQAIEKFLNAGAEFLASCFTQRPPVTGPWATSALPGYSWHNYGKAVDMYFEDPQTSQPNWDSPNYYLLQDEAANLGLNRAFFDRDQDPGHIQLPAIGMPFPPMMQIEAQMKAKFGT